MSVQPIPPINNRNPSFEMKLGKPTILRSQTVQPIHLDNGKTLDVYHYYVGDKLRYKMLYLTDEAGKFIRSILKVFENGKITKIVRSEKNV